ncbi:MAG: VOC family protein [Pseudomonadota bacterium]
MQQSTISMITLGVVDLDRSVAFYTALGWQDSKHSQPQVKFLQGHNIVLGLFGMEDLAKDANCTSAGDGFGNFVLSANQTSKENVDVFHQRALDAGATSLKEPGETFWGGYASHIQDFDGHVWEVAYNPFCAIDKYGVLDLDS